MVPLVSLGLVGICNPDLFEGQNFFEAGFAILKQSSTHDNDLCQFLACKNIDPIHNCVGQKMQFVAADRVFESHATKLQDNHGLKNLVFMIM